MLSDAILQQMMLLLMISFQNVAPAALAPLLAPPTAFSCEAQAYQGIYADVETGCQVFHFCEEGGRNHSFFCPHLTIFNQRFFVCDWHYNVDCSTAPAYFSLNSGLYATPEKIANAIQPAIQVLQQNDLQPAASTYHLGPASNRINQATSGLGFAGKTDLVRFSSPSSGISLPPSATRLSQTPIFVTAEQQLSTNLRTDSVAQYNPIYTDSADPEPSTTSASVDLQSYAVRDPVLIDSADPEPIGQSYIGSSSSIGVTYGSSSSLIDSSDPEPTAPSYTSDLSKSEISDSSDPEPTGNVQIFSDTSDPEPTYATIANGRSYESVQYSQPRSQKLIVDTSASVSFTSVDPYDSADPEPASYYGVDPSDPEPTASYTPFYDDAIADPEPDATPGAYYSDLISDPEPSAP